MKSDLSCDLCPCRKCHMQFRRDRNRADGRLPIVRNPNTPASRNPGLQDNSCNVIRFSNVGPVQTELRVFSATGTDFRTSYERRKAISITATGSATTSDLPGHSHILIPNTAVSGDSEARRVFEDRGIKLYFLGLSPMNGICKINTAHPRPATASAYGKGISPFPTMQILWIRIPNR